MEAEHKQFTDQQTIHQELRKQMRMMLKGQGSAPGVAGGKGGMSTTQSTPVKLTKEEVRANIKRYKTTSKSILGMDGRATYERKDSKVEIYDNEKIIQAEF